MRQQNHRSLREVVTGLGLPKERFHAPLIEYGEELVRELEAVCIVLFGSVARGSYTYWSDIDLLIVAEGLPEDYFKRFDLLIGLNKPCRAFDAFGYTPAEFERMLVRGHVTVLDSMADGVCLHGHEYFAKMQEVYQDMVRRGLRRGVAAWTMPAPAVSASGEDTGP